jgi:hypothetical protein
VIKSPEEADKLVSDKKKPPGSIPDKFKGGEIKLYNDKQPEP